MFFAEIWLCLSPYNSIRLNLYSVYHHGKNALQLFYSNKDNSLIINFALMKSVTNRHAGRFKKKGEYLNDKTVIH